MCYSSFSGSHETEPLKSSLYTSLSRQNVQDLPPPAESEKGEGEENETPN